MKCDICGEDMTEVTGLYDMVALKGGHIDCMMKFWKEQDNSSSKE